MPLLLLAYLAFVGLGLPDPLPGALWPELRPAYGLNTSALGAVLAAGAAGYVTSSMLAGRAMGALGVGGVLAMSVAATALAALGQALAPPWALFLALAVLAGLGGGAVDAALNAYAAARFAPRHLNWMHACWGLGATLGPALAAALLAAEAGWQAAYATVGLVLAGLALAFVATRRRWTEGAAVDGPRTPALTVLRLPVARLQILVFFLYTGIEASAGQWAATVLTEARGASPALAAAAATLFWAALAGGRVTMGFVVDRVGADRLVRLAVPAAAIAASLFAFGPRAAGLPTLGLLAAALAPIYPTLMARTPARLGAAAAAHAVGFQVAAATLGVAVLPGMIGLIADVIGPEAVAPLVAALTLLLAVLIRRLPAPARG
jgi:fucose permease